jgi:DNA-binding NarL/FixJ family response regulator
MSTPLTVGRIVFSNLPPGMFMTTVEERREAMKRKPLPVAAPVPAPAPTPVPATKPAAKPKPKGPLKPKEVQLLVELCGGLTDQGTAKRMGLDLDTFKSRLQRLRGKLHVHNRVELVVYAFRNGIVS